MHWIDKPCMTCAGLALIESSPYMTNNDPALPFLGITVSDQNHRNNGLAGSKSEVVYRSTGLVTYNDLIRSCMLG